MENPKNDWVVVVDDSHAGRLAKMLDAKHGFVALEDGTHIYVGRWLTLAPGWTAADILTTLATLHGIHDSLVFCNCGVDSPEEYTQYLRKYIEDLGFVISLDNSIVYDYQEVLTHGQCRTCFSTLKFRPAHDLDDDDDRIIQARCCGLIYSMVPEKVRVLVVPEGGPKNPDDDEESDFLKELMNL